MTGFERTRHRCSRPNNFVFELRRAQLSSHLSLLWQLSLKAGGCSSPCHFLRLTSVLRHLLLSDIPFRASVCLILFFCDLHLALGVNPLFVSFTKFFWTTTGPKRVCHTKADNKSICKRSQHQQSSLSWTITLRYECVQFCRNS